MGHVKAMFGRVGLAVLDILLPPTCMACETQVQVQGQFCADCFSHIHLITAACCRYCSAPLRSDQPWGTPEACDNCLDYPPPWREARAALRYEGQSKRVILALKYSDRPELANGLGALMASAGADLLKDAELLVPVPLHPARLRARRYNQSGLLANAISKVTGIPVSQDAIVRITPTPSLGDLSAEQRARVLHGAFGVRLGRRVTLTGKRVVLIDDVLTSGATARGCTQTLFYGGATRVDLLVATRVGDPRRR